MKRLGLLVSACLPLWGASVADVLAQVDAAIPADELAEPGNPARATALAALAASDLGLAPAELIDLRLALAEAWLDAFQSAKSSALATAVLGESAANAGQRERAGLVLIAAWAVAARAGEAGDDPAELLKPHGDLGPRVAARAAVASAERLILAKDATAIARLDAALLLLKDQPSDERVPLYALRLLAMEATGAKPKDVQAWIQARIADPAAALVADSAMTAGQKLVGRPAPRLVAPRRDGQPGNLDLAELRGKPVLLDFFATWCQPCVAQAPALTALQARLGARVQFVGVSLDTKDTVERIPAFLKEHGVTWPVVGEGLGWDSDLNPAYQVSAIPAFVLIGADGRIAAVDLAGADGAATVANIERALLELEGGGALPAAEAVPLRQPAHPEEPLP
jgi:cytochrome c biogenesis protein CcmG/thiol:disulfide interchange protein DsbE